MNLRQKPGSVKSIQDQPKSIDLEAVKACPVCGGKRLEPRFEVRQITDDLLHSDAIELGASVAPIVTCRECTFLFKSTRPSPTYLHQHYTDASESYLKSIAESDAEFREDFRVASQLLHEAFPKGGTILDVGCASGVFFGIAGTRLETTRC